MTFAVIFNGGIGCGKDSAALEMQRMFASRFFTVRQEFKAKLFELVQTAYGVSKLEWDYLYVRERKELPTPLLNGLSPRQALIHMSEKVMKPAFGKDYFGTALAKELSTWVEYSSNYKDRIVLSMISDGGFPEEVTPLVNYVGVGNLLVIRIHRDGHDFTNDSRSFLPDSDDYVTVDVDNNGTLEEFFETCEFLIDRFTKGELL